MSGPHGVGVYIRLFDTIVARINQELRSVGSEPDLVQGEAAAQGERYVKPTRCERPAFLAGLTLTAHTLGSHSTHRTAAPDLVSEGWAFESLWRQLRHAINRVHPSGGRSGC